MREEIKSRRAITGATGHFSAAHRGPDGALHGHTWLVAVEWIDTGLDARERLAELDAALAMLDHTELPAEMWRGEEIAAHLGAQLGACRVKVSRPPERIYARWPA